MKIIILNESFIKIDEIESFSSAVWTDRYVAEGEFEITLNPEAEIINSIKATNAGIKVQQKSK